MSKMVFKKWATDVYNHVPEEQHGAFEKSITKKMIIWFDVYNHLKRNVVLEALDAQTLHQPQVIVGLQQKKVKR